MYRMLITTFVVLLTLGSSSTGATETISNRDQLTVWLIPFDPPFEATWAEDRMPVKKQLDSFYGLNDSLTLSPLRTNF